VNTFFGPKMNELMDKLRESGWHEFGMMYTRQFAHEVDKRLGIQTNKMLGPEQWAKTVLEVMK
jgi:hypothetical protein